MRLGTTRWLLVGLLCLTLWPATVTPQETQWDNLNSAAVDAYQQAVYAKAEKLLLAALKVAKKFGAQDPRLATSLNNLAALYHTQGKYAEAEPLFRRSLAIWEMALGPEHPDVAQSLNNLASLYHNQGKYAQAEPLYRRALAIAEKALGPEHPPCSHQPQQPGGALSRPGQVRPGRTAHPAGAGDSGESPGPRTPGRSPEPQQPGGALSRPGQIRPGRAALPASVGDMGEDPGAGAPPGSHGLGELRCPIAQVESGRRGGQNGSPRQGHPRQARARDSPEVGTSNPLARKGRVGSTPTPGTMFSCGYKEWRVCKQARSVFRVSCVSVFRQNALPCRPPSPRGGSEQPT